MVTAHGRRAYLAAGDYVIEEPDGRGYYPCTQGIFATTYELCDAEDQPASGGHPGTGAAES